MEKALLLNDTENWYHWGCHLTSCALKQLISEKYQLNNAVSISRLRQIPYAPSQLDDFNSSDYLSKYMHDNAEIINRINEVDVVYVNGEGSLHGGSALALNLLMLMFISKAVLGKKVYLVNHSAYPNDALALHNNALDHLYKDIYNMLDGVAIRESGSLALMQQLGVSNCRQSFDCSVLALEPVDAEREKVIALGGSVSFGLQGLEKLLSVLAGYQRQGYEIRFIHGAAANPAADDIEFLRQLNQQTVCPIAAVCCHSVDEFKQQISSAAVMVSGRFHYSIVAWSLGTPPVMLTSNTPKNEMLAQQLGLPAPLSWQDDGLQQQLQQRIEVCLSDHGFSSTVEEQMRQLKSLAKQNLY